MSHKDRKRRLDYLTRYRATYRPAPTPDAQPDGKLPARGIVVFSRDGTKVQCHCCGRWFGSLNVHIRLHGLDAQSYKEAYDLSRTVSLWPTALQDKQRELAVAKIAAGKMGPHPETLRPREAGAQPHRLGTRVRASVQRQGVYTRGGERCDE